MLGNQNIYRDAFSDIGNPFDSYQGKSDIQMVRLFVMHALVAYSSERDFEGLPADEIIENLERIGVSASATEAILKDLIKKRYLFLRSHRDFSREGMLVPSRLCGYVARDLISKFAFLETVLFDTFIGEDAIWDALKENMRLIYQEKNIVRKLGMRREAVISFYDFAENLYENLCLEARNKGLPANWTFNPLTRNRDAFLDNANHALSSARRNYGASIELENLPLFNQVRN